MPRSTPTSKIPRTSIPVGARRRHQARHRGAGGGKIFVAGFLEANVIAVAVATSNGLFAYHRTTDANLSITARTPDGTGSGWASAGSRDWGAVDPAASAASPRERRSPAAIRRPSSRGLYTAVLEPQAVNDLVPLLSSCAERAERRRRAGRVFEAGRRNEHRREGAATNASRSYSDPADPQLLGHAVRRRGAAAPAHGLD